MLDPTTFAPRPAVRPQHACDCCDRPIAQCELTARARNFPMRWSDDPLIAQLEARRQADCKVRRYRRLGHERLGRIARVIDTLAAMPGTPADKIRWMVDSERATHVQFHGVAYLTFAGVGASSPVTHGADELVTRWVAEARRAIGAAR